MFPSKPKSNGNTANVSVVEKKRGLAGFEWNWLEDGKQRLGIIVFTEEVVTDEVIVWELCFLAWSQMIWKAYMEVLVLTADRKLLLQSPLDLTAKSHGKIKCQVTLCTWRRGIHD